MILTTELDTSQALGIKYEGVTFGVSGFGNGLNQHFYIWASEELSRVMRHSNIKIDKFVPNISESLDMITYAWAALLRNTELISMGFWYEERAQNIYQQR